MAAKRVLTELTEAMGGKIPTTPATLSPHGHRSASPDTLLPVALLKALLLIEEAIEKEDATLTACEAGQSPPPATMLFPPSSYLALGNPVCNTVVYGLYVLGDRSASFEVYRSVLELRRRRRNAFLPPHSIQCCDLSNVDVCNVSGSTTTSSGALPLLTFVASTKEAEALCRGDAPQPPTTSPNAIQQGNIAVLTGATLADLQQWATANDQQIDASTADAARRQFASTVLLPNTLKDALQRLVFDIDSIVDDYHTLTNSVVHDGFKLWASGGTALGIIRHGRVESVEAPSPLSGRRHIVSQVPPIPWDDDVDFCMRDVDEVHLQHAFNFPFGLPTKGIFLEFCPLFGYKIYRTELDDESSVLPSFGQYGCFVDVFLMSLTSGSSFSRQFELSLPEAQRTWPKERYTLTSPDSLALSVSPIGIGTTEMDVRLLRHLCVAEEGTTLSYLEDTFGNGDALRDARPRQASWMTCGVLPKEQHGRRFSHSVYIPLVTSSSSPET